MITFIVSSVLCLEVFTIMAQNSNNPCGSLYLTRSPYKSKNLQLNWNFNCTEPPDTILVTSRDIKENDSDSGKKLFQLNAPTLHKISPKCITRGFQETRIPMINVKLPGNWTENGENPDLNAKCFNYYVASIKKNKAIFSECLSIQPTWMSNFGDLRIGEMMIPGTHNSGAYRGIPLILQNFVLNQDQNFWQQLVHGIRFFDIRIGRYGGSPQNIYINHDFVPCTRLLPELQSAANFLKKSPKEVIILNFHRFPFPQNFTRAHHLQVITLTRSVFGDMIFPFSNVTGKGPKLNEFWSTGHRVIVSYNNEEMSREFPWLWPPVMRFWGEKIKIRDLEAYVKEVLSEPIYGNPMHVIMAELTPTFQSALTSNVKDMAVAVNRELSDWLKEDFVDNLSIIATDFFTGNNMIKEAIDTNFKKLNKLIV